MRQLLTFISFLALVHCGTSGNLGFTEVVGIPPGNGAGEALSGTFTVLFKVTSGGCSGQSLLGTMAKDETASLEVELTQDDGDFRFKSVDDVNLRGGISFDNKFNVGGSAIQSRGGEEDNFLALMSLKGEFDDANSFSGSGNERLNGRIGEDTFDCNFNFTVSGIRKD